jgi:phage protein D
VTSAVPISRVTFDGVPRSITPLACEIEQSIGQHEQVTLEMVPLAGMDSDTGAYKTISFSWDVDSSGRFYGYVTDYSVGARKNAAGTVVRITAMGPTLVMKTGRPRFFANATTAGVIARIAAEAQLGFIDEYGRDHYVWPQLAQTDESDWEFVNDLAEREGSQLLCSDGVLRLIDPQNVLARTNPVLLLTNTQMETALAVAGLFDLDSTLYSNRLPRAYTPSVAFLNEGKVETVAGSQGRFAYQQYFSAQRPVRTQAEAELAQTTLPVDWQEQAQARVSGSGKIAPGSVVAVKGGDRAAKNEPYDGHWYVTDTRHVLTKMAFQTNVSLARITASGRGLGIPAKNWWQDPRGRPSLALDNTGNWISTWR